MPAYVYNRPNPQAYFGREILIRSIADGLNQGRSFLLIGGPKIGKTSTLNQIQTRIEKNWTVEPKASKLVPVRFDCASLAKTANAAEFTQKLFLALYAALRNPKVFGQGPMLNTSPAPKTQRGEPWAIFKENCAQLWRQLEGTPSWCKTALFLDNGDSSKELNAVLFELTKFVGSDVLGAPVAMLITGGPTLSRQVHNLRSKTKVFRTTYLGPLNSGEASALIRRGFPDCDLNWSQEIENASGRHPYMLNRMLNECENHGEELNLATLTSAIMPEAEQLFAGIKSELALGRKPIYQATNNTPPHLLMRYLISRSAPTPLSTIEADLSLKSLREYVEVLFSLGVLEKTLKGNTTCLRAHFELWNSWYQKNTLTPKLPPK